MTDPAATLRSAFRQHFGAAPDLIARAPGRVNLIGEHTDYNDGFVVPAAIGCATWVAARRRGDERINVLALDSAGATDSFAVDTDAMAAGAEPWARYPRAMAWAMQQAGHRLGGADIAITGTIPQGAGLSSSASLLVATGLALAALAGAEDIDRTALARLAQTAECEFVGTRCGIMDQLVSARGEAGAALLIDCRSLSCAPIAIPAATAIMIVHSGITRGLVEGEYNARRAQCEAAAAALGIPALRDADPAMLEAAQCRMDDTAWRRARHVITENARTLATAEALRSGDLAAMGILMAQSHASMRDDFAITLPPIDRLVALLADAIGEQGGARMTGGGFGGAVVALLPADRVAEVSAAVRAGYATPAGAPPLIMVEQASAGAGIIERA